MECFRSVTQSLPHLITHQHSLPIILLVYTFPHIILSSLSSPLRQYLIILYESPLICRYASESIPNIWIYEPNRRLPRKVSVVFVT